MSSSELSWVCRYLWFEISEWYLNSRVIRVGWSCIYVHSVFELNSEDGLFDSLQFIFIVVIQLVSSSWLVLFQSWFFNLLLSPVHNKCRLATIDMDRMEYFVLQTSTFQSVRQHSAEVFKWSSVNRPTLFVLRSWNIAPFQGQWTDDVELIRFCTAR
jgi:hypothetical protein